MEIDKDEMGSQENVSKSSKPETFAEGLKQLGDEIPEWFLVQLLIRLPVKFLVRSKLVSKKWLSLISDPSFVRMYVSRATSSPRWAFISHYTHLEDSRCWGTYLKRPGPFMLPCPFTEDTLYTVVGASDGIVLFGLRGCDGNYDYRRFCICNPVTRRWSILPQHDTHNVIVSTGFLTQVESYVLVRYRVVCIEWGGVDIRVNVFISEIGEWKEFVVYVDRRFEIIRWTATAFNGILHVITVNHEIIAYDPYHNPNHLRFISLPGDTDLKCVNDRLLDGHQGKLRYLESSSRPHGFSGFSVWVLNDYSTGDWCLQHRVSCADVLYNNIFSGPDLPIPILFHPFDSDIVYLGSKEIFVSYNLKTRKLNDGGGLLDVEDIIGETKFVNYKTWPSWYRTFLLSFPTWPTHIPPPSFPFMNNW